ncbi:uncharacterized protein LOC126674415 [Mercurialis annua]|uniref:uncharacterized protein LOC126674415 n=1 Tax=Mercurialis annua TaxID=3986 RepID=UPI00215F834A|nr:uncharacterized protein LOC126674415 [Mercurialis annua]
MTKPSFFKSSYKINSPYSYSQMARLLLEHGAHHHHHRHHLIGVIGATPLAIALFVSVSILVALCAKHTRPQKHENPKTCRNVTNKSPLASPRRLATKLSNKMIDPSKKKLSDNHGGDDGGGEIIDGSEFGEGGLWQKSILMGEKCQPPEFSGVIYYDSLGNQLSEMPRSPRASPLTSFSFPVAKDTNYNY